MEPYIHTYTVDVGECVLSYIPISYLHLLCSSGVHEMSVEVRGSGRGRVGTVYTLTCTVTLSHRVRDSSVSIQWQGPSTDDQPTVDSTDNRVITRQLSLDPLTLAHGGDYTCTAVYRVNGEDIINSSDSETLTIPGMNHRSLSICTCAYHSQIL